MTTASVTMNNGSIEDTRRSIEVSAHPPDAVEVRQQSSSNNQMSLGTLKHLLHTNAVGMVQTKDTKISTRFLTSS